MPKASRDLDAVEADLCLARGRIIHAEFLGGAGPDERELSLFERAARFYRRIGDVSGEAEAQFWIGCFHQVVSGDPGQAVPALARAAELARTTNDTLTLSYALRHLGIAEHQAGRLDAARRRLEESVRLRREVGHLPGVAANLVGLTYVAIEQGRFAEARALLDDAGRLAAASHADRVSDQVRDAEAALLRSTSPREA